MDKQIHIHLHLGDSVLNLADLFGEVHTAPTQAPAPQPTAAAPSSTAESAPQPTAVVRTFYVTVYDSSRQAFALGHKLYDTMSGAESNSGADNYSDTASFELDVTNRRVIGDGFSARRFWAVLQSSDGTYSLGRNSFTSVTDLHAEYPDLFAELGGREDENGDVALSGV